ncbi:thyrotropin-releasing hormone receptor [Plakobranchus ocellatus]|uniref:Thyrotropin-releasing hormone receptor n=1 Tax=Plakobranchus ocellatus TaxID=259542 RepID=A0AAV4D4P5_9GAST|nr:thyrotropin-releasing hormone receptor [Plakobranchus ocellatus]
MKTTVLHYLTLNASDLPSNLDNTTADNLTEVQTQYNDFILVKMTYYMASYFIWVVFAVGFPGNIASVFTIMTMSTASYSKVRRTRMTTSFGIYGRKAIGAHVALLAVADTLAIISKVTYLEVSGRSSQLTTPGCSILIFVQQFLTVYVNWIVVAMTLERCLAVCFPLSVGQIYTRRKALAVIIGFALMTASVYLVLLWAFVEVDDGNSEYHCTLKQSYKPYLRGQIHYWLDACVGSIIPCMLILTGNALIVFSIRRAKKTQRTLTSEVERRGRQSRNQRQITGMLIAVSLVFLLLNIPNALFYLTKTKWSERIVPFSYDSAVFYFMARLVHALTDTNHAVNFFLYFLSMSNFRRRFIESVQCRSHSQGRLPSNCIYRTSQLYLRCPRLNREASRTLQASSAISNSCIRRFNNHTYMNYNSNGNSSVKGNSQSIKMYDYYQRAYCNNTGCSTAATSEV